MATALARTAAVTGDGLGNVILVLDVAYSGPAEELPGLMDLQPVPVVLLPGDQPAVIRSKMSAAVLADAAARGYPLTAANLTLPTFQKG